jgi:hypothetical protein
LSRRSFDELPFAGADLWKRAEFDEQVAGEKLRRGDESAGPTATTGSAFRPA